METTISQKSSLTVQFAMDYSFSSMDEYKKAYNQVYQLYSTMLELEKLSIQTPVKSYKRIFNILDQISLTIHQYCPAISHQESVKQKLNQVLKTYNYYESDKKRNEIKKSIHYYIDRFHHLLWDSTRV